MKYSYFRKIPKCWYNDNGYCKFGQECKKIHFRIICAIKSCDRKCKGRHPRLCQFEEKCKFFKKGICAFKHINPVSDNQQSNALKTKMGLLETENKNLKDKVKELEEGVSKEQNINEELKELIKVKDFTIEESKYKLANLENIASKNENEIKQLSEQTQREGCQIDKLKDDIDKLELKVWDKGEDYTNLLFLKESNEEDLENEIEKMKEEIKDKNLVIKELEQKIKTIEQNEEISEDFKKACDKCYFKGKSENNLKVHMSKEHKFTCELCEYRSTTKLQLNQHAIKEHQ